MSALSIFRKGGIPDERKKWERGQNSTAPLNTAQTISTAAEPAKTAQIAPESRNYPEFSTMSTELSTDKPSNQQLITLPCQNVNICDTNTRLPAYDPPDKLYLRIGDSLPLSCEEGGHAGRDIIGRIRNIDIERIVPNPSQPRKHFDDEAIIRLADSIRRYGILQPV
ncbi:MAG: ParB N-terminal domain-containing protein, partial [Eubacteriales bacterium]